LFSNRVVSCYDDVKKGTCRRSDCKFFHPPNHLKNVVNTNGRNNLRLRNELKQQLKSQVGPQMMGLGGVALGSTPFLAPSASYLPASPLYPVTSWQEQLQMQMQIHQTPPVISAPPTTRDANPLLVPVPIVGGSVPMDSTPRLDSPPPPPGTKVSSPGLKKKRSRTPDMDNSANQKFQPLFREIQQDPISPKAKRFSPPRANDQDHINFPFAPLQICAQPKRQTSNQEIPLDLTTSYPTFLPQQTYNYDTTYQTMLVNPSQGYMLPTTYQMFPPSFNYNYAQYPTYQYPTYPTSMPISPAQARLTGEGLNIPTITTNRSTPH